MTIIPFILSNNDGNDINSTKSKGWIMSINGKDLIFGPNFYSFIGLFLRVKWYFLKAPIWKKKEKEMIYAWLHINDICPISLCMLEGLLHLILANKIKYEVFFLKSYFVLQNK